MKHKMLLLPSADQNGTGSPSAEAPQAEATPTPVPETVPEPTPEESPKLDAAEDAAPENTETVLPSAADASSIPAEVRVETSEPSALVPAWEAFKAEMDKIPHDLSVFLFKIEEKVRGGQI